MSDASIKIWNTCGYVRLSREDGDKEESNSVTGQKDLIRDFLSRHPELRECDMKVDDGYTGSNFDRPAFQKMMEAVRAGKINWSRTYPGSAGIIWKQESTSSVSFLSWVCVLSPSTTTMTANTEMWSPMN